MTVEELTKLLLSLPEEQQKLPVHVLSRIAMNDSQIGTITVEVVEYLNVIEWRPWPNPQRKKRTP